MRLSIRRNSSGRNKITTKLISVSELICATLLVLFSCSLLANSEQLIHEKDGVQPSPEASNTNELEDQASLLIDSSGGGSNQQATSGTNNIRESNADDGDDYLVGVGMADITGPAADINLMGYAKPNQDAGGIHLRQFSRSIVVEDEHGQRIVYSSLDNGMISQLLRSRVLDRLKQQFGEQLYNETNVMLSATHSHSCPGGFFQYMLYNIPSAGFIQQTLDALVDGVVRSIERAHNSMLVAKIYYTKGELLDASVNRSPMSYANNPLEERSRYKWDTDKEMFLLRFVKKANGQPMGMVNWFPVHGTSMNNTNHLISSDNKGYAALLMEQEFNGPTTLPGRGKFVAIFAQANEGDVSPNTQGPRCIDTGLPCDFVTSTCGNPPRNEKCIASGPGKDMFESTKIIAHKQYQKARQLFLDTKNQKAVRGPVRFVHEYIDITRQEVPLYDSVLNLEAKRQQQQAELAGDPDTQTRLSASTSRQATVAAGNQQLVANRHKLTARQLSQQQQLELVALAGDSSAVGQQQTRKQSLPTIQLNASLATCVAALGYSFAAGTTDGPGAFDFQQGDTASGRYWNMVRDFLKKPSPEQQLCHQPKPILLSTGEMDFPYMWHPKVVPTQILMLGQVAIVGLPGEFTTMSGRRVRENVRAALNGQASTQSWHKSALSSINGPSNGGLESHQDSDLASEESHKARLGDGRLILDEQIKLLSGGSSSRASNKRPSLADENGFEVVLSGLSNIYSSYITTLEEYQVQRYEGASTLYGPHTLQAYINQFVKLASRLKSDLPPPDNPIKPPDLSKSLFTFKSGVIYDGAPHGKKFGYTLEDVDQKRIFECQDQVTVSFVAGNPRNDLRQEQSFLYVDKLDSESDSWVPIANDASWETKFIWERTNTLFGESRATIQWDIPHDCQSGVYRIRHYGAYKTLLQSIYQYSGESMPFKVINPRQDLGDVSMESANSTARSQALFRLDNLMKLASELQKQAQVVDLAVDRVELPRDLAKVGESRGVGSLLVAPFKWIGSLFRKAKF